jgi:hypothetical protein
MFAVDHNKISDYYDLQNYPIQLPRILVKAQKFQGLVHMHISVDCIVFSSIHEEYEGIKGFMNLSPTNRSYAYKLFFQYLRWIEIWKTPTSSNGIVGNAASIENHCVACYLADFSLVTIENPHIFPLIERLWTSYQLLQLSPFLFPPITPSTSLTYRKYSKSDTHHKQQHFSSSKKKIKLFSGNYQQCLRYYEKIIDDLLIHHAVTIEDMLEVLVEYQQEIVYDLQLKSLSFERMEIFSICMSLIEDFKAMKPKNFSFTSTGEYKNL